MKAIDIYNLCLKQVEEYHKTDSVDAPLNNPYANGTYEALLWEKSWVDTVQWHLEDLVRPDDVDPVYALQLKRRIDRSNQHRTDLVERIDDHYFARFHSVTPQPDAAINTETPHGPSTASPSWHSRYTISPSKPIVATRPTVPNAKPNSTHCSPSAPTSPPP